MSAVIQQDFPRTASAITVRTLNESDATALRNIRLYCLKTEGELMGPTYESEASKSLAEWRDAARETADKALFGMYDGDRLIGIMRAMRYDDQTALWGMTYVLPEYRGAGLSAPLYQARQEWSARRYKRAVFFIRADNKRSRDIHLKHGARFVETRPNSWPDRPPIMWNWYEVRLSS
jgi:RimJ/RimL family protein N-acetyltransferase